MKNLISVEVNGESYVIKLHDEGLDGLKDDECDLMIDHMRVYLDAYKRLRCARSELEKAEQHVERMKTDPIPYLQTREYGDLPF